MIPSKKSASSRSKKTKKASPRTPKKRVAKTLSKATRASAKRRTKTSLINREKTGKSQQYDVGRSKPPKETQFKPGQSGNPNGRPKSVTVSDALRQALKNVDPADSKGRTVAQILGEKLIELATKGRGHIKIRAIQEIVDRVEGKPRQSVEVLVPKSEIDRYESLIEQYLQAAKEQGIDLTRDQAISYLAEADNRILTVLGVASEYAQ